MGLLEQCQARNIADSILEEVFRESGYVPQTSNYIPDMDKYSDVPPIGRYIHKSNLIPKDRDHVGMW